MRAARVLAFAVAVAAGSVLGTGAGVAQKMILVITINGPNPEPVRPKTPVNTIRELSAALARCWRPPPADASREPVDVIFQVSFKRSGELFGKPRVIEFAREVTPEQRARYYAAVAEALDLCSPMPFTATMGGAVAGRVFRVNFIDMRNRRQA